jgi:hypothetical protein
MELGLSPVLPQLLDVLGMVAAMQYMGTPAELGQAAVFVVGAAIIGAYTRHYFSGIEIRDSS